MTLNNLLNKKKKEFEVMRAQLNEFAGECFLSKEDPRCDARLREVSEKINELSIEIMLLENCEELLSLDKLGETKE